MTASIVMVVRGEPLPRLERALRSLTAQDGVRDLVVLIAAPPEEHAHLGSLVPGGSIAEVRLVDNPEGTRSAGLNRAVTVAPHDIVIRVDARSIVPAGYVAACVRRLESNPRVGVVGGVQWPECHDHDANTAGIVRALRNRWLLGNAAYRRRDAHGPVDTVYLGAFRRDELLAIGAYDEALDANEDFDLAQRYRQLGWTVWLEEGLVVDYEPRHTLPALARQYRAFGAAKVRFWRHTGHRPNVRQRVALSAGVLGAATGLFTLRRPASAAGLLVLGAGAVTLLDHLAEPDEPDVRVRVRACLATAVIIVSWLAGVARELAAAPGVR